MCDAVIGPAGHVDTDFFARLDAATDYRALFEAAFHPGARVTGDELWAKCPVHADCDDAGKFSLNLRDGKWRCHKQAVGGSMIGLLKELSPRSWRDKWIAACPSTRDIFGLEVRPATTSERGSTRQTDHASLSRDRCAATTDDDLAPLVAAWGIDVVTLRRQGWFVMRGGTEGGDHPKYCLPVYSAEGKVIGIRARFLPPYPTQKQTDGSEKPVKSKLISGSKPGLLGFPSLLLRLPDGTQPPVLLVAGEKDLAVADADLGARFAVVSPSHGESMKISVANDVLRGRDVVILYDEDDPGNKGSREAATTLFQVARSVRWAHHAIPGKDTFDVLRRGGSLADLERVLAAAEPFTMAEALKDVRAVIRTAIGDDGEKLDIVEVADHIFKTLRDAGALWLKDRSGRGYCVFQGRVFECHQGNHGWALKLGEWTGVDSYGSIGGRLHRQLGALAAEHGQPCDPTAWFARKDDTLYLPLCDEHQRLVEIDCDGLRLTANGKGSVVVLPNEGMKAIRWMEEDFDEVEAEEVWSAFWKLFSCSNEDRVFLEAWVTMIPLFDWIDTHPLLRFAGDPGSGKSTAAKLITTFLYGDERLFTATNAACYRMGVNFPLICLDNVEADGVDQDLEMFFLLAATGAEKIKSNTATTGGVISERVRSWVVSTGVDPISFGKRELSERTVVIPFGANRSSDFMPRGTLAWVREHRDILWNLLIRKVQRSISRISGGALDRLARAMPAKVRHRLREFYATASIVLGDSERQNETVSWLLHEHADDEENAAVEDNPLVDLLSYLPAFLKSAAGSNMAPAAQTGMGTMVGPIQSQRLSVVLSTIARAVGRNWPFRSTQQLTTRLGIATPTLNNMGFQILREENKVDDGKRYRTWRLFIPSTLGHAVGGLFEKEGGV